MSARCTNLSESEREDAAPSVWQSVPISDREESRFSFVPQEESLIPRYVGITTMALRTLAGSRFIQSS